MRTRRLEGGRRRLPRLLAITVLGLLALFAGVAKGSVVYQVPIGVLRIAS